MADASGIDVGYPAFRPRPPWLTGDLQTLRNYLLPQRIDLASWPAERIELPMRDGSGDRLVGALHAGDAAARKPLAVLIHGLTGCADSTYVLASARQLLTSGHPVLRLNLRGSAPTRRLCREFYHAGRSGDFADALAALDPALIARGAFAVGYSLGGNMLIKYLAEQGAAGPIRAAAAVSAPIELRAASMRLMDRRNRLYHGWLLARMREERVAAGLDADAMARLRTIYAFDDAVVAPGNGFADADDYYARCSGRQFLAAVAVPFLVVHALDDPWIPADAYVSFDWSSNRNLTPLITDGGGHVGFHGAGSPVPWHDRCIAAFFGRQCASG